MGDRGISLKNNTFPTIAKSVLILWKPDRIGSMIRWCPLMVTFKKWYCKVSWNYHCRLVRRPECVFVITVNFAMKQPEFGAFALFEKGSGAPQLYLLTKRRQLDWKCTTIQESHPSDIPSSQANFIHVYNSHKKGRDNHLSLPVGEKTKVVAYLVAPMASSTASIWALRATSV